MLRLLIVLVWMASSGELERLLNCLILLPGVGRIERQPAARSRVAGCVDAQPPTASRLSACLRPDRHAGSTAFGWPREGIAGADRIGAHFDRFWPLDPRVRQTERRQRPNVSRTGQSEPAVLRAVVSGALVRLQPGEIRIARLDHASTSAIRISDLRQSGFARRNEAWAVIYVQTGGDAPRSRKQSPALLRPRLETAANDETCRWAASSSQPVRVPAAHAPSR